MGSRTIHQNRLKGTFILLPKIRYYFFYIHFVWQMIMMFVRWKLNPQPKNKLIRSELCLKIIHAIKNKYEVVGVPDLDARLILANHSSLLDIPIIETQYEQDLCWVGKSQLSGPIIGQLMKHPQHIVVDRFSKTSMIGLVKNAKKATNKGRPIAIFPEGTRSPHDELLPFKEGAKGLAEILKLKVQPIVIVGIKEAFDFKTHTLNYDCPIKIIYLDSIQISKESDKNWYSDLQVKMNNLYQEEMRKIREAL